MSLDAHAPEFSRNLGFFSIEEQQKLLDSTVAIAGAGGDGGMLAVQLARLGIGELRLADPDPFETENINRQATCTTKTVGINKAIAVGDHIRDINPDIHVVTYTDGIHGDNVEEFVKGANLVIDETEFTMHALGVMLARKARAHNVPNLMAMNIGFGTTVSTFHPEGKTFEKVLGLSETAPLDEIAEAEVSILSWLPYIPPYADIEAFKKVAAGVKSAPSVAPGVNLASAVGSAEAVLNLLHDGRNNRPQPVYAPQVKMMDAMTGESKVIKHPRLSTRAYMIRMALNNFMRRTPKVSY